MSLDDLLKLILGSAGALVVVLVGLWWMNKDRDKILAALGKERDSRISLLEEGNRACAADRLAIHNELREVQREQKHLLRAMALAATQGKCGTECLREGFTQTEESEG